MLTIARFIRVSPNRDEGHLNRAEASREIRPVDDRLLVPRVNDPARRSRGLVKYHGLVPVEQDGMLQVPAHAAGLWLRFSNAPTKRSSISNQSAITAMAFRRARSRVGMMVRLAVISAGRPLLLSFLTMLRLQSQVMQIHAAVADIWVAARLLFKERSPHRSHHDAN